MAALGFLIIGLICAVISRILLFVAAFRISLGWGIGVLVPFGPMLFRINYPDEAQKSRLFRLLTLPCFLLYLWLGPGPALGSLSHDRVMTSTAFWKKSKPTKDPHNYATETVVTMDQRRAANNKEFDRLHAWADALRLKKRDLLHSDTQGNIAYNKEMERYKVCLEKAKAERTLLWPGLQ